MKISTEQKLDNFRNMRAMISDYRTQHNRFPTIEEFEEKLEMSSATVKRYKVIILEENKIQLLKKFQDEMVIRIEDVVESIDDNVKKFKTIRDESNDENTVISAAKCIIESKLDAIRVMRDGPDFLGVDYDVSDKQEYIHGEIESEKIKSISD